MESAKEAVLAISGHSLLQENNPVLLKSLAARNPYVDCLNILQVELLSRLRAHDNDDNGDGGTGAKEDGVVIMNEGDMRREDEELLQDALLMTLNGIANGMRNSG